MTEIQKEMQKERMTERQKDKKKKRQNNRKTDGPIERGRKNDMSFEHNRECDCQGGKCKVVNS